MVEVKFAEQVGKVRMFVAQTGGGRFWANVGIEGYHPGGGWVEAFVDEFDKTTWPEAVVDLALQVLDVPDQYLEDKERIAETIQRLMAKFPVGAPGPGLAYSVTSSGTEWYEHPIDQSIARAKVDEWADWLIGEED